MIDLQKAVKGILIELPNDRNAVARQHFLICLSLRCQRVGTATDENCRRKAGNLGVPGRSGGNVWIVPPHSLGKKQLLDSSAVPVTQKPLKAGKAEKGIAQHLCGNIHAHIMEHQRAGRRQMAARRVADQGKSLPVKTVFIGVLPEIQHRIPNLLLRVGERLNIQLGIVDVHDERAALFRHVHAVAVHLACVAAYPGPAVDVKKHRPRPLFGLGPIEKDIDWLFPDAGNEKAFPYRIFPDFLSPLGPHGQL